MDNEKNDDRENCFVSFEASSEMMKGFRRDKKGFPLFAAKNAHFKPQFLLQLPRGMDAEHSLSEPLEHLHFRLYLTNSGQPGSE